MKDFDAKRKARMDRDRSFKIGGEEFTMRAGLRPEVLIPWEQLTEETSAAEVLQILDSIVLDFLEPYGDSHDRYRALRERVEEPITLQDLQELVEWLIAEQTGRPTGQPSSSTPSAVPPGTGSTEGSSLREVAGSTV